MKKVPRTVWVLGLASFFTDLSSEMIYPLLPVFLATTLGASTVALGVIEGVAEATASILKVFSGVLTDRFPRRKPLIMTGYSISGFFRPLIAFAQAWPFVLFIRFCDRVGKGIRSSPRDALIADVTDQKHLGAAYGVQRSLDHAGAVLGPGLASLVLLIPGTDLRSVFMAAAVPALLTIVVLYFGVKENKVLKSAVSPVSPPTLLHSWKKLGRTYKMFLLSLVVFTLGNSTDAFLLVLLTKSGVSAPHIALLWSAQHLVKMMCTYVGGRWADRFGYRLMMAGGWFYFALIYFFFANAHSTPAIVTLFLLYGAYFGFVEPAERAWVAKLVPDNLRGTAFGYYHFTVGIGALPASILFGWVWQQWGANAAFTLGAGLAVIASVMILFLPTKTALSNSP